VILVNIQAYSYEFVDQLNKYELLKILNMMKLLNIIERNIFVRFKRKCLGHPSL
jgi:hypothetical protein